MGYLGGGLESPDTCGEHPPAEEEEGNFKRSGGLVVGQPEGEEEEEGEGNASPVLERWVGGWRRERRFE